MIITKRKYIKRSTKQKLREALKLLLIKGYIYSYNELYRLGIEYREIQEYLVPLCNIQEKYNSDGNNRKKLILKKETKKILNESIAELLIYNNSEAIKLIKLLF